jgi:hypothetical protein
VAVGGDKFALVLLDEGLNPAAGECAGDLARLLGRVRYDVVGALKRSPGIPFEDLDEAQAARAVELLSAAGARAAAVDAARLPPFPKTFTVHKAGVSPEGLSVQTDYLGTTRGLPWDRIAALSAATLSETAGPASAPKGPSIGLQLVKVTFAAATGIPTGLFPHQPRQPAPAPRRAAAYQVLAVAVFDEPVEIRFRADELNFEGLGERMTGSSAENFRRFAGDLVTSAVLAKVSSAARALAEEGCAPPAMAADDFARHNRWLRLLACEGLS